jgi:lysophospholipase L1-like esterase
MQIFIILISLFILAISLRLTYFAFKAKFAAKKSKAFNQFQANANFRILCVGDSLSVGVGANDPINSIPGNLSKDFPHANITNYSKSGATIMKLYKYLKTKNLENYDFILVIVSGMDMIQLASLNKIKKSLEKLVSLLQQHSQKITLVPPSNTGSLPLYHFPITQILNRRSAKIQEIFNELAKDNSCLVANANLEELLKDKKKYFSADLSHPNDAGYNLWYQKIKQYLH